VDPEFAGLSELALPTFGEYDSTAVRTRHTRDGVLPEVGVATSGFLIGIIDPTHDSTEEEHRISNRVIYGDVKTFSEERGKSCLLCRGPMG